MAPQKVVKNLACVTLGLFFISLSSFLMTQIYFQNQVDSQIQNVSLLKDIRFPSWGKHPNPSSSLFSQSFTLFNLAEKVPMLISQDGQIVATKSNITKRYEYQFEYRNTSFAQGNSGRLNFINQWQLKEISGNAPSSGNVKTVNLAADKVFNYDYYAPPQRKFAILYNYLLETLTTSFLEKFYAVYLYKFFFQHKELVLDTVFKPLGFEPARATEIYEHSSLGWSNVQNFKSWVTLSLKGYKSAVKTQYYQTLITELGLTPTQIQSLTFQKSTLNSMISALNGTIKSKLMMTGITNFNYKCPEASCTNAELVAFQMASAFLTNDPLFASLNLNMGSKDLNSTLLADIEYQRFCDRNKGKFVCMSKTGMVKFFTHNYLGDFEKMDLLWRNKNNFELIRKEFDLENNTAQSVVAYVLELYDGFIAKYEDVYAWAQTNFNHLQPVVTTYKNLLLVELYSRAFFNKFLDKKEVDCKDYFVGEFSDAAATACSSENWNFVNSTKALKNIMQAYQFIGGSRDKMAADLKLSYEQIISFFNNGEASLFAKQLKQIESIFKASFGCVRNGLGLCTSEQLFCMQWGSNFIFSNLPAEIFSNKIKNINEWDQQNVLKGLNPDYFAIIGKQKTLNECIEILSSDSKNGIYNLFNVLRMGKEASENANDMLRYIGRNVMQVSFNGLLNTQDVDSLFKGFKSDIITKKNEMNVSSGGAPWLENEMKLVKTDNKIEIKNNELLSIPQFDTIDTGIYYQEKTRQISKIWGETTSSSKYTVYRGKKTDDEGTEIPVDIFYKYVTDRKVQGTNLLGFHPNLDRNEDLKIFFNQAHQAINLNYDSEMIYEDRDEIKGSINVYKYYIEMGSKSPSFIGVQELNQNYFELSPASYALVEPTTGLTLEVSLVYSIKSSPSYTKFILASSTPIDLYYSELFYKRKSLGQIQEIIDNKKSKRTFGIISIVVGSLTLALSIGLFFVYCKISKRKDGLEEALIGNDPDVPTPTSMYTEAN